ncbi:MAG: ABC transporter ATP-binding protein [Bacillota bacterium]|nr:ABC transporter ATP-binding protein [Bacillota bacterium]
MAIDNVSVEAPEKKETPSLRPLMQFLLRDRKGFVRYVLAAHLIIYDEIAFSFVIAGLIGAASGGDFPKLLLFVGVGLGLFLIGRLLYILSRHVRTKFMRDCLIELRQLSFDHILSLTQADFNRQSRDVYVSRLTNDINSIESKMFDALLRAIFNGAQAALALLIMLVLHPLSGSVVLCFTLVYTLLSRYVFDRRLITRQMAVSEANEDFVLRASNTINGGEIIKLNRLEDRFTDNLMSDAAVLERKKCRLNYFSNAVGTVMAGLSIGLQLSIILIQFSGEFTPERLANAMLIFMLSNNIVWPVQNVFVNLNILQGCSALFQKISGSEDPVVAGAGGDLPFTLDEGLTLRDLSLAYDDKRIFEGLDWTIRKGEHWRIVGPSGSGKSSLLRILSRAVGEYRGEYRIDGKDAREIELRSFYDRVAVIDQNVYLFEDSLRNNVTLYHQYPEEKIREAIDQAGLSELVASLEQGLDHPLSEDGKNLSGGQRQRIAIARALIRDAELLLVDEATASLDEATGAWIEETLLSLDTTLVSISHRNYPGVSDRYDGVLTIENRETSIRRREVLQ